MIKSLSASKASEPIYSRLFWSIVLLHVAIWAILPPFFTSSFKCDPLEMMVIGQNWVLSTHKHPAFQGWLAEIVRQILQSPRWVPYVCSQLATILAVYGIWRLAQKYLSAPLALIAALSMLSYRFFSYSSIVYNNQTFLRVFWILAILALWNALDSNKKRYWIWTGIYLILGLYCKLTMFLLVITILFYMTIDPKARQYWKTPGPWISTGICLVLFLPVLFYIFQTDFSMFFYAMKGKVMEQSFHIWSHIINPSLFLFKQLPLLLLIILPLLPLLGFHWQFRTTGFWSNSENRFLTVFSLFPLVFQLTMLIIGGGNCRTSLGCHLWLFFPLFLLHNGICHLTLARFRRSLGIVVFLIIFLFSVWGLSITIRPALNQEKWVQELFPGKELAERVEAIWRSRYSVPLSYIRGDDRLASNASLWSQTRPEVYSPLWSTEEDFEEKGGILLWWEESHRRRYTPVLSLYRNEDFFYSPETNRPDEWLKKFPNAEILPMLEIPQKTCFKADPVKIYMAIVPPKKECSTDSE